MVGLPVTSAAPTEPGPGDALGGWGAAGVAVSDRITLHLPVVYTAACTIWGDGELQGASVSPVPRGGPKGRMAGGGCELIPGRIPGVHGFWGHAGALPVFGCSLWQSPEVMQRCGKTFTSSRSLPFAWRRVWPRGAEGGGR